MLAKRVIPCLDVDRGRVVKGVSFVQLRDAGDPVELAAFYSEQRADELVFLDITASSDARETVYDMVCRTADKVFIPFTVGGGVRSEEDVRRLLESGADKTSLNTAAVADPPLVAAVARTDSAASASSSPSTPRASAKAAGRSTPTAAARPPASTPSNGRGRSSTSAPARSCSPAWTPTATSTATTCR